MRCLRRSRSSSSRGLTRSGAQDKRAAQAHAEQRTAMEQHRADRDSFLEARRVALHGLL